MSSSESEAEMDSASHAAALKKLKSTDPEFYEFLKDNDKNLLNYHDSDDDEMEDQDDAEDEEKNGDESLEEMEDEQQPDTPCDIESLRHELQNSPSIQICRKVMSLLKNSFSKNSGKNKDFVVTNSELFNDVMKVCLVELVPALSRVLKLPSRIETSDPSKSKMWKKMAATLKQYLIDILKIMPHLNEASTLELILKHIMQLVPYYSQFVKLSRGLVKKMIHTWSTSGEKARIIAFLVIYRTLKRMPHEYHSQVLKQLYLAFVRNAKFTTTTTLPVINFMKRSLTELYACHPELAYRHAFLYLRQLCIHLRNAITTKKKECFSVVYNWQFVHCISLWTEVISKLYDFEPIKSLAYPLTQLAIGTINLIPTLKYVPLRFHLVKALIYLSASTKIFIPIAALIYEALTMVDPNKKLTFSKKPLNLDIALKASKSQLLESGYQDSVISETCKLLTDYFTVYAASISFPELAFFTVHQLKSFMKKNKVAKYGQQLKALCDALQQNSQFISKERNTVSFEITDTEKIKEWEESMLKKRTPLMTLRNDTAEPPKKKMKLK